MVIPLTLSDSCAVTATLVYYGKMMVKQGTGRKGLLPWKMVLDVPIRRGKCGASAFVDATLNPYSRFIMLASPVTLCLTGTGGLKVYSKYYQQAINKLNEMGLGCRSRCIKVSLCPIAEVYPHCQCE